MQHAIFLFLSSSCNMNTCSCNVFYCKDVYYSSIRLCLKLLPVLAFGTPFFFPSPCNNNTCLGNANIIFFFKVERYVSYALCIKFLPVRALETPFFQFVQSEHLFGQLEHHFIFFKKLSDICRTHFVSNFVQFVH